MTIEELKEIVRRAGRLIAQKNEDARIDEKPGSANYVTQYDVRVQRFLMEELSSRLPGCSFVCEEEQWSSRTVEQGDTFIIDPIDGTTNFICNFLFSGISVALAHDGRTRMAVVYNPFREELFWAERGKGAFLNDTPLHLADRTLAEGVVDFGTAPYNPELRDASFALARVIADHTMDLRELGSASLALCYVAAGRCVAYYSPRLCVWDYAAAELLIEEAGGRVTALDGRPLCYATKVPVLAGAAKAVEEFLTLAAKCSAAL